VANQQSDLEPLLAKIPGYGQHFVL